MTLHHSQCDRCRKLTIFSEGSAHCHCRLQLKSLAMKVFLTIPPGCWAVVCGVASCMLAVGARLIVSPPNNCEEWEYDGESGRGAEGGHSHGNEIILSELGNAGRSPSGLHCGDEPLPAAGDQEMHKTVREGESRGREENTSDTFLLSISHFPRSYPVREARRACGGVLTAELMRRLSVSEQLM